MKPELNINQKDKIRIMHMIESIEEALHFTKEVSFESFSSDRKLILSIIKEIEIIGEAASKLFRYSLDRYS